MSDILELGKAVNEKCQSKDGSVDHRYWAFRSVELLPALIAETERLRSANSHLHSICQKQQDTLDAYRHQNVDYYGKITAKDARIKELEAYIERLEAAFLEQFVQGIQAPREMAELMAHEALERIKNVP